jgi:hypothetical protein
VTFCLGLALFVWLQLGTFLLANREASLGDTTNGTRLHRIVLGESALLIVCTVALLSLRRSWSTRIAILTVFIWAICLIDILAFAQATVVS